MLDDPDVLLELPDALRGELKDPLGPVHEDMDGLLHRLSGTLVTVGDVVSYHCQEAGRSPDVAVIDGRTKRSAVEPEIEAALAEPAVSRIEAVNPPGTITQSLLDALVEALERSEPVQVVVEGEEDLAALPAIVAARNGTHVLYGQPDEGVVHVRVEHESQRRARELLRAMDGEVGAVLARLTA